MKKNTSPPPPSKNIFPLIFLYIRSLFISPPPKYKIKSSRFQKFEILFSQIPYLINNILAHIVVLYFSDLWSHQLFPMIHILYNNMLPHLKIIFLFSSLRCYMSTLLIILQWLPEDLWMVNSIIDIKRSLPHDSNYSFCNIRLSKTKPSSTKRSCLGSAPSIRFAWTGSRICWSASASGCISFTWYYLVKFMSNTSYSPEKSLTRHPLIISLPQSYLLLISIVVTFPWERERERETVVGFVTTLTS